MKAVSKHNCILIWFNNVVHGYFTSQYDKGPPRGFGLQFVV